MTSNAKDMLSRSAPQTILPDRIRSSDSTAKQIQRGESSARQFQQDGHSPLVNAIASKIAASNGGNILDNGLLRKVSLIMARANEGLATNESLATSVASKIAAANGVTSNRSLMSAVASRFYDPDGTPNDKLTTALASKILNAVNEAEAQGDCSISNHSGPSGIKAASVPNRKRKSNATASESDATSEVSTAKASSETTKVQKRKEVASKKVANDETPVNPSNLKTGQLNHEEWTSSSSGLINNGVNHNSKQSEIKNQAKKLKMKTRASDSVATIVGKSFDNYHIMKDVGALSKTGDMSHLEMEALLADSNNLLSSSPGSIFAAASRDQRLPSSGLSASEIAALKILEDSSNPLLSAALRGGALSNNSAYQSMPCMGEKLICCEACNGTGFVTIPNNVTRRSVIPRPSSLFPQYNFPISHPPVPSYEPILKNTDMQSLYASSKRQILTRHVLEEEFKRRIYEEL